MPHLLRNRVKNHKEMSYHWTVIPPPMVMSVFVEQNHQPSSTALNISRGQILENADPFTKNDLCYPMPSGGGASIDTARKLSITTIPHLARSIPWSLDDLCLNNLPLCYSQYQSIPPGWEEFFTHKHTCY